MFDLPQLSGRLVNSEHGNRIMSSVRTVQEPTRRMDANLSGTLASNKCLGQCFDGLQPLQLSLPGVVVENRDRCGQFAIHVGELATRMPGKMSRSTAGLNAGRRRIVSRQQSIVRIKVVSKHPVRSQIRSERDLVVGRQINRMSVRRCLPLDVHTSTTMPNHRTRRRQRTVFPDRQNRNVAAHVVGQQNIPPGPIHNQVTRCIAFR